MSETHTENKKPSYFVLLHTSKRPFLIEDLAFKKKIVLCVCVCVREREREGEEDEEEKKKAKTTEYNKRIIKNSDFSNRVNH